MPDYVKRAAEVLQYVLDFVAWSSGQARLPPETGLDRTMTPGQDDNRTAPAGEERVHFQNQVPAYFVARNRHLNELIAAMDVLAAGDDDLVSKWKTPLDGLVTDAQGTLGTILSGIDKKSDRAVALKWKIQAEEDLFVKQLQGMAVAAKWMALRTLHRQLMNQIVSLRTRWESIKSKARDINGSAMDAVDRMDSQLHAAFDAGKSGYSNAFAAVDDARNRIDGMTAQGSFSQGSVGDGLQAAADSMEKAGSSLSSMSSNYAAALANVQAGLSALDGLQGAELSGVQKIFKDVRSEIAEYVREPASNRARALEKEGEDMLASWVSGINQGPGMRADAADFSQDVSRKPFLGLGALLQNYETFENENKGRFYEDLSGDVLAALLLQDNWNSHSQWLLSAEAADHPNSFELSLAVYFSVPLEKSYNDLIAAVPDKADESIREALKFAIAQNRDQVLSQYRTNSDPLRSSLRNLADLMKSQDFRKYFERTNVLNNLKS